MYRLCTHIVQIWSFRYNICILTSTILGKDVRHVSLYDAARKLVNEYRRSQSGKLWQSYLLAAKLRDLRNREHLTQAALAERAGISESALRNYELQKSTPKQEHLEALADALDIRPEALRLYDIDQFPANALFQLGETYGLLPCKSESMKDRDERFAILEPRTHYLMAALRDWVERYRLLKAGEIQRDDYERWKDRFCSEYDSAEFPARYRRAGNDFEPIEPWQNTQLASTLQRLRKDKKLTQGQLGEMTGCSMTTIRAYEQKKRLPKSAQLKELALALDVTEGALVFFDYESPVQAVHALFQIANQYGLVPELVDGAPVLRTIQPGLERYIDQWSWALSGRYENADTDDGKRPTSYQQWKDRYDPKNSFGTQWESRYRYYFGAANRFNGAMDSDNDPFDERYAEQGGFLRA